MGETVLISFVFFREPADTFETADSVVVEAQPRPTDTFDIADAVTSLISESTQQIHQLPMSQQYLM